MQLPTCVFISHSSHDREFVEQEIIGLLQSHSIRTWYSKDDIATASQWNNSILLGLRKCDWFLVVLSSQSITSNWVLAEVNWAFEHRENAVVPVLKEECDWKNFHLLLSNCQHSDFRIDYDFGKRQLLGTWGVAPKNPDPEQLGSKRRVGKDIDEEGDDSKTVADLIQWAWVKLKEGDFVSCIKICDKALGLDSGCLEALIIRSEAHIKLNNLPDALIDCNAAERIAPDDARTYQNRGRVYHKLNQFNDAIDEFTKAIRLDSIDATTFWHRGHSHLGMNNFQAANADFARAIVLDPGDVTAIYDRGKLLSRAGNLVAAISAYTDVIHLDPDNSSAFIDRGISYAKLNRLHETLADFKRAKRLGVTETEYSRAFVTVREARSKSLKAFDAAAGKELLRLMSSWQFK